MVCLVLAVLYPPQRPAEQFHAAATQAGKNAMHLICQALPQRPHQQPCSNDSIHDLVQNFAGRQIVSFDLHAFQNCMTAAAQKLISNAFVSHAFIHLSCSEYTGP